MREDSEVCFGMQSVVAVVILPSFGRPLCVRTANERVKLRRCLCTSSRLVIVDDRRRDILDVRAYPRNGTTQEEWSC